MKSTTRRAAARKRRAERNNALRFFAPAFRPMFRQLWRRRICGEKIESHTELSDCTLTIVIPPDDLL